MGKRKGEGNEKREGEGGGESGRENRKLGNEEKVGERKKREEVGDRRKSKGKEMEKG